jgi:ABC-type nitrate/sulfonate/bicarbonate transport system substrate-binding protein
VKAIATTIAALVMVFTITSCSPAAPAPEPTPATVEVSLQLSWIHEYSSSVFHAAERNGHFAAQGLKVNLVEAGFDEAGFIDDTIQEVVDGKVDFALSNSASLIQARAEGKPVVAVASILQRSPLAVISLPETGLTRPQDLVDHTISVTDGGALAVYNTLLHTQDIALSSVNTIPRTTFGVDPLTNGEVDGMVAWVINEGVAVQELGFDPQYILMSDYGVDMYDFVLFTTEATIEQKPELVRGLVDAVRAGAQDVVDNPAQAIKHTLTYNGDLVEAEQLRRLEATIPFINVPGRELGSMDAEVWQFTHDFLLQQGLLAEPIALDEAYTLEFFADEAG